MKSGSRVNDAIRALQIWLEKSGIEPGGRIPPEREISSELNATHYAINRAVGILVAEGMLKREGYKIYYTPTVSSASRSSYVYIAPNTSINARLTRKIARSLKYDLQFVTWDSLEYLYFVLSKICKQNPDGIIFEVPFSSQVHKWKPNLERFTVANIPCVCVLQPVKDFAGVVQDYGAAVTEAFHYLVENGHTELALLSVQERPQSALEILNGWEVQCHQHERSASRERIYVGAQRSPREDARELAKILSRNWQTVTGVIAQDRAIVPHLIEELALRGRSVPKDISIICIGDETYLKTSTPPVSTVNIDNALCMESAFRLLDWMAAKKAATGKLPPPQCFRLQPRLFLRGSTKPLIQNAPPEPPNRRTEINDGENEQWPDDPTQLAYLLDSIRRRPYPLTSGASESRFLPISLKKHLNRPLNFRRGWLGDLPLRNLGTGKQSIHGIPFNIENGSTRAEQGAVVFRSLKNSTGRGKPLPDRVRIKIGCRAKAVYILHSCGYSTFMSPFATYEFHSSSGIVEAVPLVALGARPHAMESKEWAEAVAKANIQDWWPDYVHPDFPHTKRVIVAQDEKTMQSHRYIYTLEWINPVPEEEIDFVEIRVDSKQPTTLGLISISVLKT